jgi:hypothetical protein
MEKEREGRGERKRGGEEWKRGIEMGSPDNTRPYCNSKHPNNSVLKFWEV